MVPYISYLRFNIVYIYLSNNMCMYCYSLNRSKTFKILFFGFSLTKNKNSIFRKTIF